MKSVRIILMSLFVAGALTFTACDSEVEVREGDDTTVVDTDHKDTTSGSTVGNTIDTAGQTMGDEAVEKAVEAKLVMEKGFENVDVESKPDGIIVLTGMAATEAEKMKAAEIAKGTDGVTGVENNITVGAAQ
jgi:osmotically-inducible protein OsmY